MLRWSKQPFRCSIWISADWHFLRQRAFTNGCVPNEMVSKCKLNYELFISQFNSLYMQLFVKSKFCLLFVFSFECAYDSEDSLVNCKAPCCFKFCPVMNQGLLCGTLGLEISFSTASPQTNVPLVVRTTFLIFFYNIVPILHLPQGTILH